MEMFYMYMRCPKCGENGFERVERKWWMRFMPQSRFFRCYLCNYATIDLLGRHPSTGPRQPAGAIRDLYVRANDVTYGPTSLEEVHSWAAGGRLHGDHEISSDGNLWKPAKTAPELGLTWEVNTAIKSGPHVLNPAAVRELARDGAIPEDATVTDLTTGKTMPLAEALKVNA